MTQKSIFWTTGATGDGASEYTQAELFRWMRQMMVGDTDEGVHKNYLGELEVAGVASPVTVEDGAAIVYGSPFWSTVQETVAVPTPAGATRIDRIVLQATWSTQLVRLARVAGVEGSGTPPALTQTDGVTWEISLAQVSITTGGVITVTDEREWLHPNIEVSTAMLEDLAVTTAKLGADAVTGGKIADDAVDSEHIADDAIDSNHYVDGSIDTAHLANNAVDDTKVGNRVPQVYRRQGGSATIWSATGVTTYTPGAVRIQCGVVEWTGSLASTGSITVTFPVAFSYSPIVVATAQFGTDQDIVINVQHVSASQVTMRWRKTTGATAGAVDINWVAVGPE